MKNFSFKKRYGALVSVAGLGVIAAVCSAKAKFHAPVHASVAAMSARNTFLPTVQNQTPAPGNAPAGMNWIPGGEFSMGSKDPTLLPEGGHEAMEDARPIHQQARVLAGVRELPKRPRRIAEGAKRSGVTAFKV